MHPQRLFILEKILTNALNIPIVRLLRMEMELLHTRN